MTSEPCILLVVRSPRGITQWGKSVRLQEQFLHGSERNMEMSPTPVMSMPQYNKAEKHE